MQYKTRSQLIEENTILRARLAKLEGRLADQSSAAGALLERGAGEHRLSKKILQNSRAYLGPGQRASSQEWWSSNDQAQAHGNTNGKPTRVASTARDLTEHQQIEDALKASEARYRRLFETARDGILVLDADTGRLIDVNPFLEDMLGYTHEELLGKRLWEIGLFRDIAASRAAFRHLQNLEESLSHELRQARRRNSSLCVAMLDFDHFKRFNDTHGHDAGDAMLREFGQMLREKLRRSDILCRYGGEEFVLVLPDSSLAHASQCMEDIRVLVKTLQIRHGEQLLGTMTVSTGIAKAHEHGSTIRELLRAADEAMYAAKQAWRDRVVIYQMRDQHMNFSIQAV